MRTIPPRPTDAIDLTNIPRDKINETHLAALIIRYLQDLGWEVYQEVQIFSFSRRADIVAVKGPITWVIETKMNMGLDVIQQAHGWHAFANYVSIGIPAKLRSRTTSFGKTVCRKFGIGTLSCDFNRTYNSGVDEHVRPVLFRKPLKHLRRALNEEHKTYARAGNADGKFWSPFKATCKNLEKAVKQEPGMTMKELIKSVEHHYASETAARGSIVQWVRAGKIKGLRLDETVRPMRVYPDE